MEVDTLFDDSLYVNNIKEHTIFFEKKKLLNFLVDEIINDLKLFSGDEIRFAYIVYSKLDISTYKINEILNFMIQYKYPDIYVKSKWDIFEQITGNTDINGISQTVTADKIKIKFIIKKNDKDLTIKKLIQDKLFSLQKKKNKNIYTYLEEFK